MPLAEGHSEGKVALTKKQDVSGADGVSVEPIAVVAVMRKGKGKPLGYGWYSVLMWGVRAVWLVAVLLMRVAMLLCQEHLSLLRLRGTTPPARDNCVPHIRPVAVHKLITHVASRVHYVMLSQPVRCVSYVSSNSIFPSKLHTQRFLVFRRHTRCQVL